MESGDRWHVAAAEGRGGGQDKTIINQILLRFRPIAPKPAAGSSTSGESMNVRSPCKRVKRKYIRTKKNNRSCTTDPKATSDLSAVTLQLIPEETGSRDSSGAGSWVNRDETVAKIPDYRDHLPAWMKLNPTYGRVEKTVGAAPRSDPTAEVGAPVVVVESLVTVESLTDTCMDVGVLGCTDVEKVRNLEKDTCPGFISDGYNRVQWVNEAYKKMVQSPEVVVWLASKTELPPADGFSCRVRLQYTWRKDKCWKMVVPCDVWRMQEYAGLAWRLDTKAALSLGL